MFEIFYCLVSAFWFFDIFNLSFMAMFDTLYPINFTEWLLIWMAIQPTYLLIHRREKK